MMLRVALETSVHHAQADADRLAVMDAKTPDEYRSFLERVYGFESVVEAALARGPGLDPALVRRTLKMQKLEQDLVALGVSRADIDLLPVASIQPFRSAPQAAGWMFVVERQTLLSGLIRRHLARPLRDEMQRAAGYLNAYGDTPGARFRAYGDALADIAQAHTPDAIVVAAREAFRAQRMWYLGLSRSRLRAS